MRSTGFADILVLANLSCSLFREAVPNNSAVLNLTFSELSHLHSMPMGRYGMGSTTDGKYLYAINGSTTDRIYSSDIIRYDWMLDEWSELTSKLTPKRYVTAEYVLDKMFVFGGYFQNVFMYSP